jgi:hypothetical protein
MRGDRSNHDLILADTGISITNLFFLPLQPFVRRKDNAYWFVSRP